MELLVIIGIGFGLSLDAFAVSIANSIMIHGLEEKHGLRMSVFFGLFQMIMPVFGWAAGITFNKYISSFDHWVAFGLLAFIGGRMIISGLPFKKEKDRNDCNEDKVQDCRNLPTLLMLSIATSIDAMAVGLSFAMIQISIWLPVIIIGLITFLVSLTGYFLGVKIGHKLNLPLEIIGGIVLTSIGIKILAEHLI